MRVDVRLGGGLARLAGRPRLQVELADGATVADLVLAVSTAHPPLAPALTAALAVVAGAPVGAGDCLNEGQEVSLIMPAAGGQR